MRREITVKEALEFAAEKHREGRFDEAKDIYLGILKEFPENPDALHLLGLIFHQEGNFKKAIDFIEKAISFRQEAVYYGNLGMSYDSLGNDEKSAELFLKALELNPSYATAYLAHYNLGVYFKENGEIEKSLEHYNKSIELNPEFAETRWNRSLILLLLGKFEEGWADYSYRFKKADPTDSRNFGKPRWDGSSLEGKKILIVSEQGFGDNIQFVRYLPLVKERGGKIILECRKELLELFKNVEGVDEIFEKGNLPEDFDCYIHIMDLPRIFRTNLENIPNKIPYLKANPEKIEKFRNEISELNSNKFKVGIVWAGNPKQENDKNRSAKFENFEKLKEAENIVLFSLQKGRNEKLPEEVIDLSNKLNDFSDTAAIIENLDLIVSVDTSVAHLAGAMGKQVWTLLTYIPDWRWFLKQKDCPWYSTMRLFRQKQKGDWNSVVEEVCKELKTL